VKLTYGSMAIGAESIRRVRLGLEYPPAKESAKKVLETVPRRAWTPNAELMSALHHFARVQQSGTEQIGEQR